MTGAAIRLVLLVAVLAPFLIARPAIAAPDGEAPLVTFFIQFDQTQPEPAWTAVLRRTAEEAAADMGLAYETVPTGVGREEANRAIRARMEQGRAPDYAIIVNYRSQAAEQLRYFDERGVHAYLFNAGLTPPERAEIGEPREVLRHWIGEMTPDDESAGYELARHLIAEAKARTASRPVRMVGLTGSKANPVAVARVKGLERAVAEDDDVVLSQVVSARWNAEVGRAKFEHLINRYPDTDIVWAANDDMAMAVVESRRRPAGLVVGGMDWTPEAVAAIGAGDMAASMGGHFIDAAYVIARIAQHARGEPLPAGVEKSSLAILSADRIGDWVPNTGEASLATFDFSRLLEQPADDQAVSFGAFLSTQDTPGRDR